MTRKDWVKRGKKKAGGKKKNRFIERRKCPCCGRTFRLLPDDQIPFKHYSAEVIEKVIDDDFTDEELDEYEDYPCDTTMERWRKWAEQLVKNAEGQIRSAAYRICDFSVEFLVQKESLLNEIKKRIRYGWLSFIVGMMIDTGGAGTLPEPP